MEVRGTLHVENAKRALRGARESVAAAREALGGGFNFRLYNFAKDVAARNPKHEIFIFDAVDGGTRAYGRVAIVAMENQTNEFPMLHYKKDASHWVVTKQVGASRPLRIRDRASQILDGRLSGVIAEVWEALAVNGLPNGSVFVGALRAMEQAVKDAYQKATLDAAVRHAVKQNWYGVPSTPLSDSFETLEGNQS